MIRRAAAIATLALVASLTPTPSHAADTRYVSFLVGRGLYAQSEGCKQMPGTVTTMQVAAYAHRLRIPMSANLIPTYVDAGNGGRFCHGGGMHLYLSLTDTRTLRDRYGWQHLTSGLAYRQMTTLSRTEQKREACGALNWMDAHGFNRARGLFAPANPDGPNMSDQALAVAKSCGYVKIRDYGYRTWALAPRRADGSRIDTNVRGHLDPDGYYRTKSVNGGDCPATVQCGTGANRRYMLPAEMLNDLQDAPRGSHMVIQAYRWVTGKSRGWWNCDGPVEAHWTKQAELYCWGDYKRILDGLPTDYIATDPLTVARAWGTR